MIIVKIRGGIGNQFFQYLTGRKLVIKSKSHMILDTSWYRAADREFFLDQLNTVYTTNISNRFIIQVLNLFLQPRIIKDRWDLGKIEVDVGEHISLDGFWVSRMEYLDELKDTIYKELTLKNPSIHFLEYLKKIDGTNSISVHVRRGDYLVNKEYIVQSKEYYLEAISMIIATKELKKPMVTIFSDDISWCMENLASINGVETSIWCDKKVSDLEQLFLMSEHTHNIICNSTFSVWAAILNTNQNKVVIAPKNWASQNNDNAVRDLMSFGWKVI